MNEPDFDLVTLSANVQFEACNPTSFSTGFDELVIVVYYNDMDLATLTVRGDNVPPNTVTYLDGDMAINPQIFVGLLLQELSNAFSNDQNGLNQENITVTSTLEAKIIGVIPFNQTKTYTTQEFQQLADSRGSNSFSCTV